jgi:hypothetical protein
MRIGASVCGGSDWPLKYLVGLLGGRLRQPYRRLLFLAMKICQVSQLLQQWSVIDFFVAP